MTTKNYFDSNQINHRLPPSQYLWKTRGVNVSFVNNIAEFAIELVNYFKLFVVFIMNFNLESYYSTCLKYVTNFHLVYSK